MVIKDTDLILVAVMNDLRDLEIARLLGWYRIPVLHAPKVIQVDWVAFYQTAAFKDHQWCIEWYAQVLGHELVKRKDLLKGENEHPRAEDLYYKVQLGPVRKLTLPIKAGNWKRITFFYTTGEYVNRAEFIQDLIVRTDERKLLWQAMRERAAANKDYATEYLPDEEIRPEIIEEILGLAFYEEDNNI